MIGLGQQSLALARPTLLQQALSAIRRNGGTLLMVPDSYVGVFEDSTGITPVDALGDPIGLITDRSYGAGNLGAEIASLTTPWQVLGTGISQNTGTGTMTFSASPAGQNALRGVSLVAGKTYVLEFTIASISGGAIQMLVGGGAGTVAATAPGTYRATVRATAPDGPYLWVSTAATTAVVTASSCREVLGSHATQATASQKPVAGRVPKRLGPNLLADGSFDDAPKWVAQAGWAVTGGAAVATGAAVNANIQPAAGAYAATEVGKSYRAEVTITALTSGSVQLVIWSGSTNVAQTAIITAAGTYSVSYVATTTQCRPYLTAQSTGASLTAASISQSEVLEWTNAISFDGGNDFLSAPVSTVGGGETLIIGCTPTGGPGTVRAALVRRDDAAKTGVMIYADAANTWQLAGGNGSSFVATPFGASAQLDVPVVLSAVCSGSTATPYINGVAGTVAGSLSPVANVATPLSIGSLLGTFPFPGPVTAAVRVPSAMSNQDRVIVERWIGSLQGQTL